MKKKLLNKYLVFYHLYFVNISHRVILKATDKQFYSNVKQVFENILYF